MENEFVTYEQALSLKELGFDEICFATFNMDKKVSRNPSHNMEDLPIEGQPYYWNNSKIHKDTVTAPLKQQAFRWFREVHNSISHIEMSGDKFFWCLLWKEDLKKFTAINRCITYEEAETKCIDYIISLIKAKVDNFPLSTSVNI